MCSYYYCYYYGGDDDDDEDDAADDNTNNNNNSMLYLNKHAQTMTICCRVAKMTGSWGTQFIIIALPSSIR